MIDKKLTRFSPMGDGTTEFFDDGDWCYWDEVEELIKELEAEVKRLTPFQDSYLAQKLVLDLCAWDLKQAQAENERLKAMPTSSEAVRAVKLEDEIDRLKAENARLRGENAMLLAAADADAFNLNTLQRCCCQRGARMQKMYAAIKDCTYPDNMDKEFSAWFDEDGVPIDEGGA